ncbi:MAG TPA: class II aldolase/adducin family protein [Firmicutes bacterium]|nr:class II aldolase/adducin family protein [Bacillota bacterium]
MNEKLKASVLQYFDRLREYGLHGEGDSVSVRTEGGMLFVDNSREVKFVKAGEAKGEAALHEGIYAQTDAAAVVHAHPDYVSAVAKAGVTIPAVIDDMAQIVGPTCRTVEGKEAAAKELKKRNSCLMKGDGAVTTGRTLNEAFTCMMVLQKAAICFVSASVLGGNVVINGLEARLMRFVYKKKYSKINTENNMEREGK